MDDILHDNGLLFSLFLFCVNFSYFKKKNNNNNFVKPEIKLK